MNHRSAGWLACAMLGLACLAYAQTPRDDATTRPADATAQPGNATTRPERELTVQQQATLRSIRHQHATFQQFPLVGTFKWSDLFYTTMDGGQLRLEWVGNFTTGNRQQRVQIEGSEDTWVAAVRPVNMPQGVTQVVTLTCLCPDEYLGEGIWCVVVVLMQDTINITTQYGVAADNLIFRFQQQADGRVMIMLLNPQGRGKINAQHAASSLSELMDKHPNPVRQYLQPALRMLNADAALRPGPADVYLVFDEIPPDASVMRQVEALLPGLDSADYVQREQATQALEALGRPGVLAVRRIKDRALSQEQRTRLATFLAQHSRRRIDDPAGARRDLRFLADCLEDEDPQVRSAARSALQAALGEGELPFDPMQDPQQQAQQIDQIHQRVAKALSHPAEAEGE